jgi:hypothetical protein
MGAVAVLGGIWEIVSGPTGLARSAREGEQGDARLHGGNRRPAVPSHWDALSTAVSPAGPALLPSGTEASGYESHVLLIGCLVRWWAGW